MKKITIYIIQTLFLLFTTSTSLQGFHSYPENSNLLLNSQIDARTYSALQINGQVYPVFGLSLCQGKVQQINTTTRPYSITVDSKVFLLQEPSQFHFDYINGAAFGLDPFTNQDFTSVFEHLFALNLPFTFKMPQNSLITLKKQYYIYSSNTILDFQNSTIEWQGDGKNGKERNTAIFNFRGTVQYQSSYPVPIKILTRFNEYPNTYIEFPDTPKELFTTDYINLRTTQSNNMKANQIDRNPIYSGLFKILWKTSINYGKGTRMKVPGNFPWTLIYTTKLSIISPNIHSGIKNLTIKNKKTYASITEATQKATTGINFQSTSGNFAQNINGEHLWNPLVTVYASRDYTINQGTNLDPQSTTAGRGYFIQIGDCQNCHAKNLKARKNRHLVDFTGCQNCSVQNCQSERERDTSYSLHGQWEYDILIKNCTGSVGLAISSSRHWNFGDIAYNVTIDNVKGFKLMNFRKAYNINIQNSEFELAHTNDFQFRFENSKVTKYIRIQDVSLHPMFDNQIKEALVVNSTVKCEPWDNAGHRPKCIEDGAKVELVDSILDIRPQNGKGSRNNPIGNLNMTGGQLWGGNRHASFRGSWVLRNVEFVRTTLALTEHTVGGSELKLLGCYQNPEYSQKTGVIVNKIPKEGVKDPETNINSRSQFFNLLISGGDWYVREGHGKSYVLFDLGWPYKSINMQILKPNIWSGIVKGNLKYRTSYTGSIFYKLGNVGTDTQISVQI